MTTTKYRTGGYVRAGECPIKAVEVTRETYSSVWQAGIDGRQAKRSNYYNFFDTFDEAATFLLSKSRKRLDDAIEELSVAEEEHRALMELTQ